MKTKRLGSLLLAVILCVILLFPVSAASSQAMEAAESLHALGLLQGSGKKPDGSINYDLDRAMSREEGITMLVRLLGMENAATAGTWKTPFSDVSAWAEPYVGYAYANGLTNGISSTAFGGGQKYTLTAAEYLTFVLRSLGYQSGTDFQWDSAWTLTDSLGITHGEYNAANNKSFLRGDMAIVSLSAYQYSKGNGTKTPAPAPQARSVLNAEEIYAKCSPAVVFLAVYDADGYPVATGSGFFIDADGTLVTNYHVIEGSASVTVETTEEKSYEVLGVYNYSIEEDWAVLQVDGSGFPFLTPGAQETITGGAAVYAIGSPLALQNSITEGIISNVSREIDGMRYIQTSAAISHGSSGGALINKYGEVIGITSGSIEEGQSLNLAVPLSYVDTTKPASGYTPLSSVMESEKQQYSAHDILGAFLIIFGEKEVFPDDGDTMTIFSLSVPDDQGDYFELSYVPETDSLYFSEYYDTMYEHVSTMISLDADPRISYGNIAYTDYSRNTGGISGGIFTKSDPTDFAFSDWDEQMPIPFTDAEDLCYEMILDLIFMGDDVFDYFGIPVSMEDFGFAYDF